MSLKIAVYAICKNESKHLERFLSSVRDADYILICDTGSIDDTKAQLENLKTEYTNLHTYDIAVSPWRFDVARNTALSLLPNDIDVCIKLDLDESMTEGWRQSIEKTWIRGETTRLSYWFQATPTLKYIAYWIHSRFGYYWNYPIHEYIYKSPDFKESLAYTPDLLTVHQSDKSKPRHYLTALISAVKENPDPRNLYYLGREYHTHAKYNDCITTMNKYLQHPASAYREERMSARLYMARAYIRCQQPEEAKQQMLLASVECPHRREPFLMLAEQAYYAKNWVYGLAMVKELLSRNESSDAFSEPECGNYKPYDIGHCCAYYCGAKEESITMLDKALQLSVNDSIVFNRMLNNAKIASEELYNKYRTT